MSAAPAQPPAAAKEAPPTSGAEVGGEEDAPDAKIAAQPLGPQEVEGAHTIAETPRPAARVPAERKLEFVKKDADGRVREFAGRLFARPAVFPAPDRTLRSYWVEKSPKIDQALLVGEFFSHDDRSHWRVLGMRPRRPVGPAVEYDVVKLNRRAGKGKKGARSDGQEVVMRLCESDCPNAQLLFLQQLVFLQEFREAFVNHPQRHRFAEFVSSGAFEQLCYKEREDDFEAAKVLLLTPRPHPRPFFLLQRVGPTVEDVLRANEFGILDVSSARFIAIGMMQTLRLMHEMGWVHRCVSPFTFALRVGPNGLAADQDLCFNVVCVDAGFPRRFRSVNHPPRRVAPFAGTFKYASIAALEHKEQMPNDDLHAALFVFCELVHGQLPWRGVRDEIVKLKRKLQDEPPVLIDNTSHRKFAIDLRRLPEAFRRVDAFNPFRCVEYVVYRDVYTLLNVIAETNRHTITEDYVLVEKFKNVAKKLRALTDRLKKRPGAKDGDVTTLTVEPRSEKKPTPLTTPEGTRTTPLPPTHTQLPVTSSTKATNDPTPTPTDTRSGRSKKKPKATHFTPTTTTESAKQRKQTPHAEDPFSNLPTGLPGTQRLSLVPQSHGPQTTPTNAAPTQPTNQSAL